MKIIVHSFVLFVLAICFSAIIIPSAAAVTLTFDNTVGADSSAIVNTDGSVYFNENGGGLNPVPVSGAGQAAIGNGSWQAGASGQYNHLTVYALDIGSGGVNEAAFTGFGSGSATIRIRDIESFSFETNQPTGTSLADWNLTIYTLPDTVDDDAWYGRRTLFEPAYAYSFSGPKDVWNTWSSESGTNQLGMLDKAPGTASTSSGFSGGPTLNDVTSGDVLWDPSTEGGLWPTSGLSKGPSGSTATLNYQDEIVWLLRLNIGSPNNHPMLIDNFQFTLKEFFDSGVDPNLVAGQNVLIDFEDPNFVALVAIPEPGSLSLMGLGLMVLLGRRRRSG